MEVKIENFRTFKDTGWMPIKNINILVGENSSGKSSFAASLKFIFDMFATDSQASFNSDPFFLGSFKDIAHYRGGRAGRAKNFSFALASEPTKQRGEHLDDNADLFGDLHVGQAGFRVEFTERKAQALMSVIEVSSGPDLIKLKFSDSSIYVSDSSDRDIELRSPFRSKSANMSFDISYLHYLLSDLRFFRVNREDEINDYEQSIFEKVNRLNEKILGVIRKFSLSTIASLPVRTEPRRVYQVSERETLRAGNQAAYELAQLRAFEQREWGELRRSLEQFGEASGLFRKIDVRHLSANKDGPFQIEVKIGKQTSNIIDVGYGVSQALPLIVDLLRTKKSSVFFVQQPEVHLHPQAQVELASLIGQLAKRFDHKIFIETHSDFIVDRIRTDVRDKGYMSSNDAQLLFFNRSELDSEIHSIGMDKKGNLSDVPDVYRKFFLREKMRSIGV